MSEKIQKIMSRAGVGSRRHSESLIEAGRVTINGKVATLGERADASQDVIAVDGKELDNTKSIYIMLNKPRNVLSSTEDELDEGRTTVRDLVDVAGHLYPVGRLDKQSLGLILLTNDGDMAHKLTHPRYEHEKVYRMLLEGSPSEQTMNEWRRGVDLEGKKTLPAAIRFVRKKEDATWFQIVMREGRKRQIRRVAAQLGHPVRTLIRTQLGPLKLGDLEQGKWRHLSAGEVAAIRREIRRHDKRREYPKKKTFGQNKPGRRKY